MKNRQLSLFIILSICICACTSNQITPYKTYRTFSATLENKNYSSAVDMLSHQNRDYILKDSTPSEFEYYFPFLSSVNTFIANETVHYQENGLLKACLTINGYNSNKKPATMNLKFLNEKGNWKLDCIGIIYHESEDDFPQAVICPQRPEW
ncbi:MAG: hypothetical protein GY737_26850 [Desulfobacteraceae bacterium]|nr:hypothetical protein [Desulfobacteraceae bacterium]